MKLKKDILVIDWIKEEKFDFIVGVPCSELKETLKQIKYIPSTREDEAIGIAVGAYLAGKKPLVFMQNSGVGISINAILSLLKPYDINITLLITQHNTAEHHKYTADTVADLLNVCGYDNFVLTKEDRLI